MSRRLLVYGATGVALAHFLRHTWPRQCETFPAALEASDAVLVIDDLDPEPDIGIPVIRTSIARADGLCMAAAWNAGLDWATWSTEAPAVMILGADGVLLKPIEELPATGFGAGPIWYEKPCRLRGEWGTGCYYVFTRAVFSRYRYYEAFRNWGYEDCDLEVCQLWADGILKSDLDVRAMHVWHEQRSWHTPGGEASNTLLYVRRRIRTSQRLGLDPRTMPTSPREAPFHQEALQLEGVA